MKKIFFLIATTLISIGAFAAPTNYHRYEKPFIFVENGVEFAVFNDGQFDFNIIQSNRANVHINTRNINFSFNTGHNYDVFVQYDNYGAVIQVENTPIFYDNYGRVRRIGATHMYYNHLGYASRIGNLHIRYNDYGVYYGQTGYINSYHCSYSPRHRYYRIPPQNRCVINTRPYRRNYTAHRYSYQNYSRRYAERPNYYNNHRRDYRYTQKRRHTNYHNNSVNRYNNSKRYVTPHRNDSFKRGYSSGNNRNYISRKSQGNNHRSYSSRSSSQRSPKTVERKYTPRKSYASNSSSNRTYRRR